MKKVNLFVDMDGVLAVYDLNVEDKMYNKGFFLNRPAIEPMVQIVKNLVKDERYKVHILTSCIDSEYCIPEKSAWLNKNLPEIPEENRIYIPYGSVKSEYAQKRVDTENALNILLDDYNENLIKWDLPGALPIKVLNGINSENGLWGSIGGEKIQAYSDVQENIKNIENLILKNL